MGFVEASWEYHWVDEDIQITLLHCSDFVSNLKY